MTPIQWRIMAAQIREDRTYDAELAAVISRGDRTARKINYWRHKQ